MNEQNIDDLRAGQAVQPFIPAPPPAIMQVESASTAMAAQAKAQVEARYVMAINRPRNWNQVRLDIKKECNRPAFAHNKSAFYKKPIGAGVEGLGIRFVEVALRCMTNVLIESNLIFEDELKEVHRITVTDLESNLTYPMDVRVSRTVERSKVPDGVIPISQRMNSWNKPVFTIPATDDDLLNKRGALISKAIRTLGLRIIPGDLQDEAEEIIKKVRLDKAAQDPDAEAKKIADAFDSLRVSAVDLESYLGHGLGKCSPAQLVDLRGLYGAIKDGETTWAAVMDNKASQDESKPKPQPTVNKATGEVFDPAIHLDPSKTNQDGSFTKRPIRHKAGKGQAAAPRDPLAGVIARMRAAKDIDQLEAARELANGPEFALSEEDIGHLDGQYSELFAKLKSGGESEDPGADFGNME